MNQTVTPTFRTRSVKRRALTAARGGTMRQLRRAFGDKLSERLDVMPEMVWSDARTRRVFRFIDETGIADELHARLRTHPGKRCSFEPTVLIAAVILGVMAGLSCELTDIVRSLNALPPWARLRHGIHDQSGHFVSYSTLDHQLTRLVGALDVGWQGRAGGERDMAWLFDALFAACPTISGVEVTAASLDGYVYESWVHGSRKRIPKELADNRDMRAVELVLEDDHEGLIGLGDVEPAVEPIVEAVPETEAPMLVAGHPVRPQRKVIETGGGWGIKTETRSRAKSWVFGYELHIIREVGGGSYQGDPTTFSLDKDRPMGRITGFEVRRISRDRAGAGVSVVARTKQAHAKLREVIVDRGYSNLVKENFRGPVEALGVAAVLSLMPDDLVRKPDVLTVPIGRRSSAREEGKTATLLTTAGAFFHELTPPELLENPRLGLTGTQERREAIAHYEKRAAYLWSPHEMRGNGRLRLRCPVHAGKIRPLDPIQATRAGKLGLPALRATPGILTCCTQATLTITAGERDKLYQEVPFGTRAWLTSYGRRNLSESTNSLLHSQLIRITRGFTRVHTLAKTNFLLGLALVAINLLIFERHSKDVDVVVDELVETIIELRPVPTTPAVVGQRTFYVRTPGHFQPPRRT